MLGLVACASHVRGQGLVLSTPATTSPTTVTSSASSTSSVPTSSPPPSSSYSPPPGLLRKSVQTVIGDPVTADLCTAIGLQPFRNLANGLTPSFDEVQYAPGCSITESRGSTPVVGVGVFARRGMPPQVTGRTQRVVSGRTVFVYPFDASSGACRRDIAASGLLLTVDAYPLGSAAPDETLSCTGSDAMVNQLAAVVSAGHVPRVPLASPSISKLDACAVVQKAAVTDLDAFSGADVNAQGYGVSCVVKPASAFLFFNFAISDTATPSNAKAVTVDGHQLYEMTPSADYCSYVSTQGTTPDGRHEQMIATATVNPGATAPSQMCEQTGVALAQYLTAARLP